MLCSQNSIHVCEEKRKIQNKMYCIHNTPGNQYGHNDTGTHACVTVSTEKPEADQNRSHT